MGIIFHVGKAMWEAVYAAVVARECGLTVGVYGANTEFGMYLT